MYIDPSYLLIYMACGATIYWLITKGHETDENGYTVTGIIIGLIVLISYTDFSAKYVIISFVETAIGAGALHLFMKGKKK